MPDTYTASIATLSGKKGTACELVVVRPDGDIVFGPVDLGVPVHHPVRYEFAKDAADEMLKRDGWKRTSGWDSDYGELFADVEMTAATVTLNPADVVEIIDEPEPECICPPGLRARGGFTSTCPAHGSWPAATAREEQAGAGH